MYMFLNQIYIYIICPCRRAIAALPSETMYMFMNMHAWRKKKLGLDKLWQEQGQNWKHNEPSLQKLKGRGLHLVLWSQRLVTWHTGLATLWPDDKGKKTTYIYIYYVWNTDAMAFFSCKYISKKKMFLSGLTELDDLEFNIL